MNELIFFLHIWIVLAFALGALRLGQAALTAFIGLQGVLANLLVVKQMSLFGLTVTCSDVFSIGGILSLNLLQEYFGKDAAKRAVNISLGALLFFALMSQIHLFYQPAPFDATHGA
ncbi:MAG: queuosine precursor transporter, partial [Verrucomicrobia bacterium]|nr:queuosine precursor transporter [Verrucomicrobiota bacterium]